MTYNTDPRKPLRGKARQAFLEAHGSRCYFCGEPIFPDQPWHDEHKMAKELMPPGSDWNAPENRAPIHVEPCHKIKTAIDRKIIAKSNRVRRKHGLDPDRRKPKPKMRSAGFQPGHRPIKGRSTFEKKRKP